MAQRLAGVARSACSVPNQRSLLIAYAYVVWVLATAGPWFRRGYP